MFYQALAKGPFKVPGFHDPDSKRLFGLILRPSFWTPNTVYYRQDDDNYDVVMPTVFTGLYFKVKHPGLSGATEPSWIKEIGQITDDSTNGLAWEAVQFNLMPPGVDISSVTYNATDSVTLSGLTNTVGAVTFFIDPLPAAAEAAGKFDVTLHVTKSNGEIDDYTLRFKVAER